MRGGDPKRDAPACPYCGAGNFQFASFCIGCGEPLGEEAEAGGRGSWVGGQDLPGSSDPRSPTPDPWTGILPAAYRLLISVVNRVRVGRVETALGVLLVVGVAGYVVYDWQSSSAHWKAYDEGLAAERGKDWDRAAASFDRASGLHDASQRGQVAEQKVQERDRLYGEAVGAVG